MNAFMTHPSVRIKGTENNYEPVQCMDPNCPNKTPHMHCPFCVKTDCFQDPVILRAHYRVKHVDKGIDFAGLQVLRCCDHCDIVGTIKGVKEFKGAHWHCYKCKNGFNRKDEAIKHYRTHFRNPHTTFQIQITQEVNQMTGLGMEESEVATETITTHEGDFSMQTIHPALAEAALSASSTDVTTGTLLTSQPAEATMANGKSSDSSELQVSVAANETVGTSDGQTIMIIQEDQIEGGLTNSVQLSSVEKAQLVLHVAQLNQKNLQLEASKAEMEQEYTKQIEQLKVQLEMQAQELAHYQKREQELLQQLSIPLDSRIQELLQQLKANHEDLLHQQLAQLKRLHMNQEAKDGSIIVISEPSDDSVNTTTMSQVQTDSSGTYQIVMTPNTSGVTEIVDTISQSNIMTTADGASIKIVSTSTFDENATESLHMDDQVEEDSILIEEKVEELDSEETQETSVEPPSKRKKPL